jgi:GLPGLI family protein
MKKNIYLLLIFLSISINSQEFKGIIEYGKKSIKKELSEKSKKRKKENPELFKKFEKVRNAISEAEKKLTFKLLFKNNISIFKVNPMLQSDNKRAYETAIGGYDAGIYFNDTSERLLQLNAYGELFLIKKTKLKWIILKERKKIGKYNCLKATTVIIINSKGKKRVITAWFTPKIPVAFGPLGYSGLPGLILELEVYKKIYYAKKITLNSEEEIEVKKPTKGILVTENEFQNVGKETMRKLKKNNGF